uniref:F-box domain protein n=1 Tax=Pithovirus LCPAC406 TaxID=2506599 RepID=A0A481ZCS1_9VIRU|nr:MAG: F-box domain protein [Pithovirus LCPAC406]
MSSITNISVEEILTKLRFNYQDLNELPIVQLKDILANLTVKEILLLCTTNKKFNAACKEESFWKNKVFSDYGIEKKYGATWRKTAQRMSQINMINMNKKWTNGRTYKELFDMAMQEIADELNVMRMVEINKIFTEYPPCFSNKFAYLNNEQEFQDYAEVNLKRQLTREELDKLEFVNSREMLVIYAASGTYESGKRRGKDLLPGDNNHYSQFDYNNIPNQKEFILQLFDPMLYVMQFSSFPIEELRKFST